VVVGGCFPLLSLANALLCAVRGGLLLVPGAAVLRVVDGGLPGVAGALPRRLRLPDLHAGGGHVPYGAHAEGDLHSRVCTVTP